jgi:hypothetical protein
MAQADGGTSDLPPMLNIYLMRFGFSEWRLALNNYLQNRYKTTDSLSWEYERAGPDHACNWVAIAYSEPFSSLLVSN